MPCTPNSAIAVSSEASSVKAHPPGPNATKSRQHKDPRNDFQLGSKAHTCSSMPQRKPHCGTQIKEVLYLLAREHCAATAIPLCAMFRRTYGSCERPINVVEITSFRSSRKSIEACDIAPMVGVHWAGHIRVHERTSTCGCHTSKRGKRLGTTWSP